MHEPGCSKWGGHCNFMPLETRRASPQYKWSGICSSFNSSSQRGGGRQDIWCRAEHPTHAIRATPTAGVTRATSVSPCVLLTYFSSTTFTLETNVYLQTCHQAEYIRKLLQTPDKSSSFTKTWNSKGVELTDKRLLQPKNFCNAEREGVTAQTVDLPSFAFAQSELSASSLSPRTDKGCAKCQEEDRTHCEGSGNWSPFMSIAALTGTSPVPFKYSRLFLLRLFAWVLPSAAPFILTWKCSIAQLVFINKCCFDECFW